MKQMQMDFTRADQLGWLDTAVIGATPIRVGSRTVNVSGKLAKAVLRCIDSHGRGVDGRCFVSVNTIARETGYSEKSIDRAIAALRARSLVMVDDTRRTNRYTVVWGELATLASRSVNLSQSSVGHQLPMSSDMLHQSANSAPAIGSVVSSTCEDLPTCLENHPQSSVGHQLPTTPKMLHQSANSAPAIRDMVSATRDMVSTTRDMVSSNRDMVTLKAYEAQEPPPTDARAPKSESSAAADRFSSARAWADVEERLRSLKPALDRWPVAVRDAKRLGMTPQSMMEIIDEYSLNAAKFRGPGAIIDRIRNASWSAPILNIADAAEAKRKATERAKAKEREKAEFLEAQKRPMAPWSAEELAGLEKLGVKL